MEGSETESRWRCLVLAALALCAALAAIGFAYAKALDAPFVWDDHLLLGPSSPVASGEGLRNPFGHSFWELGDRQATQPYYRPLTIFSLALDRALWGPDPHGFHRSNLALHGLVCVLVFALARRTGAGVGAAALATLLFGLSPRLTESVTFVSGRTDLLAGLAALSAVALHRSEPSAHAWRVAAAVALLAGLLSKEVALAAALAIGAVELARMSHDSAGLRRALRNLLPVTAAIVGYASLRAGVGVALGGGTLLSPSERVASSFQALGQYVAMIATPWDPNLVVGTLGVPSPGLFVTGLLAAIGIAGLGAALAGRRIRPELGMIAVLGLAAIAPVLHLVPIPIRALAADRFLYLPLAALAIVAAVLATRLPRPVARTGAAAALVLAGAFAAWTHERNAHWQDEETLWRVSAESAPRYNGVADFEYANVLGQRGKTRQAIVHYRRSLEAERDFQTLYPEHAIPVALLSRFGLVLAERGHAQEALRMLAEVVRQRPREPEGWLNFATALSRSLHFEDADRAFAKALDLYPAYGNAQQARRQNRLAARLWQELPPDAENEPAAVRSQRADVYFQVGRLSRANRLWKAVVEAPDAGERELAAAQRALALQHQLVGQTEDSLALERALAARN